MKPSQVAAAHFPWPAMHVLMVALGVSTMRQVKAREEVTEVLTGVCGGAVGERRWWGWG